jgi:hypothetical protein
VTIETMREVRRMAPLQHASVTSGLTDWGFTDLDQVAKVTNRAIAISLFFPSTEIRRGRAPLLPSSLPRRYLVATSSLPRRALRSPCC